MVHGVGRHDPLSSLLRIYQSFRSNLRSPEAPVLFEDRIPDWRLDDVNEDAVPPYLRLVPRFPSEAADISAVYLYEVNYSTLAGIVRQNHPLDLTRLFTGFDMGVVSTRQALKDSRPTIDVGDPARLSRILQRISGVLVAATVPILGAPSMLLRNYTDTFVAAYTRFFEDVATFALDKNGEQLIAAHIDRTVENIVGSTRFTGIDGTLNSELVIAAHSLGTVVVHNQLVRKWTSANVDCVPSRLVTFGSPIGLITWLWLFLDFPGLAFNADEPSGTNYFCWSPASNAGKAAKRITWINVLNRLDPIATAFPLAAADLSRPAAEVSASLTGGSVVHRFCGDSNLTSVGAAHMTYLHDRSGLLEILLRTADLRHDDPLKVETAAPDTHWRATQSTLETMSMLLWLSAVALAVAYCGLVAWTFDDARVLLASGLFAFPRVTIWLLAFWQRLFFGGPTKRIPTERIAALSWFDLTSFPYRLRLLVGPLFGARREVDINQPGRTFATRVLKVLSFVPAFAGMMAPVAIGSMLGGTLPSPRTSMIGWYLGGLAAFMAYLIICVASELVASWRAVVTELGLGAAPPIQ